MPRVNAIRLKLDYDFKKRDNYYHAFDEFDAIKITQYDQAKIEALMQNTGIIRHLGKINAIINNAKAYLAITEHQSFSDYLWGLQHQMANPSSTTPKHLPTYPPKMKSRQDWQKP